MTETQKAYRETIKAISGKDALKNKSYRLGNAGIAITVSCLENGNLAIKHLTKEIPDFTQSELRMALKTLKENGYFVKSEDEKDKRETRYKICVDTDAGIESEIFWALLANVAQGYLTRK